jgi:hypothetical protein
LLGHFRGPANKFNSLKIKTRTHLPFEEKGKPQESSKNGRHHDPPIHGVEVDAKKNEDTGTKSEAERAVCVLHDLKTNEKELYPHCRGNQHGSKVYSQQRRGFFCKKGTDKQH